MISQEYISDSEDESDMILDRSTVSPSRLAHILRDLPPSQRQSVSSGVTPMGSDVNEVQAPRPIEPAHQIENTEVVEEAPINDNELQEIPQYENELQEDENNNNLRIYLDSRNFEPVASRRGLRKRNFASTHPYLADQAHYLGLSSINYLNELYDNEQDFELIVKYLNFSYKKMKESNPKDEKYKAKNFYAILGKQSAIAQAKENESKDDNNDFNQDNNSQSQTQNIELEEENSSYELDDSLVYANVPDRPFDMPEANDSFGEETDQIRLSKKDHQLNYRQLQRKKKQEPRRGLAIKKTATTPKLNRRKDVFDFVDDANDFDGDNQFYRRFDTSHEAMSDFDTPLKGVDTFGILSDSSSESDAGMPQGYHSDVLFVRSSESPKPPTWNNEIQVSHGTRIDSDSSVEEVDLINPMFANRKTQKRKANMPGEKRQKQSSKLTNSSSGIANRSTLTPSKYSKGPTSKLSRRSEGTPRLDSKAPKSNISSSSIEHNSDNEAVSISKVLERNYPTPIKSTSKPRRRTNGPVARGTLLKKPFRSSKKTQKPQKTSSSDNKSSEPKSKPISGKNPKELLKDNYQFLRSPVAYTTAFEAESEKVFVKERSPKHPAMIRLNETNFPNEFILRLFDLKRISQINEGKTYILPFDIAHVVFMGESFSLNLFDKFQSIKNCERILFLFIKELRNLQIMPFQRIELELYSVIKGLLRWFLIVQESPSERTWKLLNRSVTDLLQNNPNPEFGQKSLMIYPWIVLIFFVLDVMVKKTEQSKEFSQLTSVASQYWRLFFQWFDIHSEIPPNSKQRESFLIMCQVLNLQRNWWSSISDAVDELSGLIDPELIMEKLYFLVMSVPREQIVDISKRWECFHKLYNHISRDMTSDSHVRFYDIVMNISQTFHWKIEEPMLFMFYNTITSRKFENFEDEWAVPQILGRIRTRSDIPIETFFDKFIYLLYNYISDLPTDGNKKKLITKLITSSHYNYQKDKHHFVMFLNRLNFILFLSQLSNIDLKNQLHDLIQRVRNCKDSEIFAAVCEGLKEYVEITVTKNRNLPVACFKVLMDGLIEDHVSIGSVQKIWDSIFRIFQRIVSHYVDSKYLVQFFEIYNVISESLTDKLSLELHRLLSKALLILETRKYFDIGSDELMKAGIEKTLNGTQDKIYSLLHKTMSRLPLPNITEENKLDPLIELYFQLWVKVTSLLPATNWNKLVLQIFPYIGNSVLRDKFKLYFYLQLSLFTSYEPFIDDVLIGIFRSLACYSPSKYQAQLMNQLNKEKDDVILFQKQYVPDELTPLFILNFRAQLIQNMFSNLSRSFKPTVTKSIYIEEFLKTLNEEFDKYFSSTWYKEFCTVCIKTIQKHCGDLVSKNALLRELASKLSIPQYELDKYNWCLLPLTDRLHSLNKEIVNAIYFGKDAVPILRTYTFDDGVELIYHLVSIYSRAIGMNQSGRWKYNYYLLDFFVENLKLFKFEIFDGSFRRFLTMLVGIFHLEVGTLANKTDRLYRTKILILIVKTIQFACFLCEGYQDYEEMDNFRLALLDDTRTDEPVTYYSSFRLFDIQDVRDENAGIALNEEVDDETVAAEELSLSKLLESINTTSKPIETGTIDLDLEV